MSGSPGEGPLHRAAHGPPPRAGEDFSRSAARLAGQAGVAFGWTPELFWNATPAELAVLVRAVAGEA
ncbi:phage tail assembly chaperone, partial [Sphingomonas sp. CCH9-E2]|uniref:phage tail assembly chaperone n=1 Tax=Sphingomonas sp. CCH9-E2 TaxID=1768776 RepID=UPI0012E332C8